MTPTQPGPLDQTSVRRHLLLPFFSYFLLLASTSFIAGGIVHVGLGENTAYYLTLAVVGVVCFTAGNYLQEFVLRANRRPMNLASFLLISFVLSVGMGMMTGGVQHFLDNPTYSSVLIPVGLLLSVLAFLAREGVRLGRKLPALVGGIVATAALLFGTLSGVARAIAVPGSQGHSHGAAGHQAAPATQPEAAAGTDTQAAQPAQRVAETGHEAAHAAPAQVEPEPAHAAEEHGAAHAAPAEAAAHDASGDAHTDHDDH
ncbi:hypothetical protein [Deinococcus aquaedulcis]|uniref:hypothetical protein n=1 Tax=Deinococcus aquaedulcis TaxID=2840455 RepID=UPI001C835D6C|nr:hypothetical protein [Deinococcus aquaedulcis]